MCGTWYPTCNFANIIPTYQPISIYQTCNEGEVCREEENVGS